ncbi:MAG: prolyl oligopeptidase family serine peptidase [Armatimonadetes bacterium]|nr:prolyl oligopeptidase family serine peptidase [Armatimonadota bacterium]
MTGTSHAKTPEPGDQAPQSFKKQITRTVSADYLLYLPKEYSKDKTARWPLILFLHGAGERGSDVQKVKAHGPPKLVAQGKEFPFIIVSPQVPEGEWWNPETLNALLDEVMKAYRVDPDRVYLTGLSMGGFGTWNLAAESPGRFAAIAPICGGGEPRRARRIRDIPTWVFHGAKDEVVPLQASQEMVDALKKAGGDVKFTVYPEAGHDSWTETYNNPELYEWFLRHRRKTEEKK